MALVSVLSVGCSHPRADDLEAIHQAFESAAPEVGWPGFVPAEIPLVLYDDENTYLMRHPAPPERFREMRGADGVWVADTLFADFRANTDVEYGGVRTAVAALAEDADPLETAAVLMHEAFHAHQTVHTPGWTANEVDLFTYPIRSAGLLYLRRLEGGALRRAIAAPDSVRELCFARAFLDVREARFARLPEEAVAYERNSELREGLARYIQAGVAGTEPIIPADGFRPEDVRDRAYEAGHAIALLLDRLAPGWKRSLVESDEPVSLDEALRAAIGDIQVRDCAAAPDEAARARALASADSADLVERDARALAAFDGARGWSLEIVAGREPLNARRFDPLNVRVLDDRHVLHSRWVSVGNDRISAEVLDRTALTRGLRGHPLFAGIDRFRVTGLREPDIAQTGDTIVVEGDGLTVRAVGVELERDGQAIRLIASR